MSESGDVPTAPPSAAPATGGVWALPLLALGLGLIACCLVIPATDTNQGLVLERERLRAELDGLERQVTTNERFLDRIHADPELAERLADRQSASTPAGVATLASQTPRGQVGLGDFSTSPFALVRAEPGPPAARAARPAGGRLAAYCRASRTRLAVLGVGAFCCLFGLLGGNAAAREATKLAS